MARVDKRGNRKKNRRATEPPERLPYSELLRAWWAISEDYRHCFTCYALSEQAADDLIEALQAARGQQKAS